MCFGGIETLVFSAKKVQLHEGFKSSCTISISFLDVNIE